VRSPGAISIVCLPLANVDNVNSTANVDNVNP
jgi:hypothetical protein